MRTKLEEILTPILKLRSLGQPAMESETIDFLKNHSEIDVISVRFFHAQNGWITNTRLGNEM